MKTFFKTNLIAVFAVLLAVGTMSFKLAERSSFDTEYWFEVDASGNIISYYGTVLPLECSMEKKVNRCAQSYTEEQTEVVGGQRVLKPTTHPSNYQNEAFRED